MNIKLNASRFVSKLAIVAACLVASPAMAAPMEIEDIGKIQNASNLTVAPDGQTIAYTVSKYPDMIAGEKDGSSLSQLYVLRPGADPVLFTSGKRSVSRLHFSPDGQSIYFLTRRGDDKTNTLYNIPISGGEATKVFQHDTSIGDYAISPDGESLYFVATEKGKDTSKLKKKGFNAYAYEEDLDMGIAWRADLNGDDAKAEKLFDDKHVTALELSPNGKTLVVAAVPTALVDDVLMKSRLHALDAVTGRVRAEVETPGKLGSFVISPDNKRIAFQAGTDISDTSDGILMVADIKNGRFEQLTPDALYNASRHCCS